MKRILPLVFILMFAIPVLAEPINSSQFVYAYIVRAIDHGATISKDDSVISTDTSFSAPPVRLEIKDGKVMTGMFRLDKDLDTLNRLTAFLGAFIAPIPSFDSAQDIIDNGYLSHVFAFMDVMEKATIENPYKLCDNYEASVFNGNVFVDYVNETP